MSPSVFDSGGLTLGRRTHPSAYMPYVPRFICGDLDLELTLPSTFLVKDYDRVVVGGDAEADSGRRASFIVRRDELWTFTLRFYETEWPDVEAFIECAQTGVGFRFYPNRLEEPTLSYRVRLVAPAVGERYFATPHPEYPVVLLLPITITTAHDAGEPEECGIVVFEDGFEGSPGSDLVTANNEFAATWPAFEFTGGYGVLEAQGEGNILGDPIPFGSRFVGHTAIAGGSAQFGAETPTYGRARALHRTVRTLDKNGDPLLPNTYYLVEFWMNMGWLQSSEIGAFPGPHTVSVGMLDDNGRGVVNSLWCWYAVSAEPQQYSPSGSAAPEFPIRNKVYIIDHNTTQFARELIPALNGWKQYSFFTLSNEAGEIGLTFGRFDTANYAGGSGFDGIEIRTICPDDEDRGYAERPVVVDCRTTQMVLEWMQQIQDADLRTTQMVIEHMSTVPDPDLYTTQMVLEEMATVPDPDLYTTQMVLEYMTTDVGS